MKSPNIKLTSGAQAATRTLRATLVALALCPVVFCSCRSVDSTTGSSSSSSNNPYAQYEPKTPEEEAYYRDVYSGDWREQSNVVGLGKSVSKLSGSTEMPSHWAALPPGAKTLEEIRQESSARKMAAARMSASYGATQASTVPTPAPVAPAPTQVAYSAPAQTEAPVAYVAAATQPAYGEPASTASYPQQVAYDGAAVAQPTQAPTATYPQAVAPSENVYPQAQPQAVAPTQNVYPQAPATYQGAAVERASFEWIVRGQEAEEDEDESFFDSDEEEEEELEFADSDSDDEADEAESADEAEPAVEVKAENVNAKAANEDAVAPNADAKAPQAQEAAPVDARPGKVDVQNAKIDPSIAVPFKDVHTASDSAPQGVDPNAPRSQQDEYVITGGDSKGKVISREDWSVENLDPEDTAAHFDTVDGRILTEPTNRLFIYSPRFGAVRQVVGPIEGDHRMALETAVSNDAPTEGQRLASPDVRTQEIKALGTAGVQDVSSADSAVGSMTAAGRIALIEVGGRARLGAMLTAQNVDNLSSDDSAMMMDGALAAQAWDGEQGVAISTDLVNAFSNAYIEGPSTVFAIKDGTVTSKMRVIKIANKSAARPGEFVEFTLRFENIGDEPIGNATILDNLSPRLRYVDGTAKSSVQADFLADLSETGSLVLRWEIAKPLQPKEFGVVQFICKVR